MVTDLVIPFVLWIMAFAIGPLIGSHDSISTRKRPTFSHLMADGEMRLLFLVVRTSLVRVLVSCGNCSTHLLLPPLPDD